MVYCYAFGCNHSSAKSKCNYFRFPLNVRKWKQWETVCRRSDRGVNQNDRLCGCHFKDGLKENGPTIFSFSKPVSSVNIPQPEVKKRKVVKTEDAIAQQSQDTVPDHEDTVSDHEDTVSDHEDTVLDHEDTVPNIHEDTVPTVPDHPYSHPCLRTCIIDKEAMIEKISNLEEKIVDLQEQIEKKSEMKTRMRINHIMKNNKKMMLYTCLPYDVFMILLSMIQRKQPISYIRGWTVATIPLSDQLLMTLMKLRLNLRDLDLSERFVTSRATVSNIVETLVQILYELLHTDVTVVGIPRRLRRKASMPASTADARAVPDDAEATQDVPSGSDERSSKPTAQDVKGVATVDFYLVSASGVVIENRCEFGDAIENRCELSDKFVSPSASVSASGDAIVNRCELSDRDKAVGRVDVTNSYLISDSGDAVVKRCELSQDVAERVCLNILPVVIGRSHFSKQELELCQKIARSKMHIARSNERLKLFEILHRIPFNYRLVSTKIFQVCSCLAHLQQSFLKEIADKCKCD